MRHSSRPVKSGRSAATPSEEGLGCPLPTLIGHAGAQRLALLVDDAPLLDSASATLIHYLATTTDAALVLTVRESDALGAPDAIGALWKEQVLERVDIGPLTADEIDELLTSVLGGPIEPEAVTELAG